MTNTNNGKGKVVIVSGPSGVGKSTICREVLKKMSRQELVRLFRRKAHERHPDKGGNHEKFVDLTHAYHVLLKTKE